MCRKQWLGVSVVVLLVVSGGSFGAAAMDELLIEAVQRGDRAAVRAMLKEAADVNEPSADGTTALHWAVHRDDVELVDALLRAGANVKATNRYGVAPISLAAQNGNAAIVEWLIAAGANANSTLPGGETALMTAARTGKVQAIEVLLEHGADVNARTPRGQTALMWAAARNNAEAVTLFVERGADINERTSNTQQDAGREWLFDAPSPTGFTALLFAGRAGSIDAVRALLDAGADANDTLSNGQSALVLALANTHWQVADFLLDRGADPNLAGSAWNALHQAVRWRRPNPNGRLAAPIPTGSLDSIDVIKKMIAHEVNVNARMTSNGMKDGQRNRLIRTGATAFFLAAKNADVEAMKVLLDAGADPTIPNLENTTPLMVAAGLYIYHPGEDGGSLPGDADEVLEAVRLCIEQGNDVNAVDVFGYTALHGAAFRGLPSVVEYLVEQGAKLDARTNVYEQETSTFLPAGENSPKLDARANAGWTPLAIASGFSYSDFYTEQPDTLALLRKLMEERGLSTEDHLIDPMVCLDCLQTHPPSREAYLERERKLDALAASLLSQQ